jgi:signal transduction histidine kinase
MPPSANGSLAELPNVVELPVRRDDDELVVQLTRRNEALEDFAALVAHELKTPLQAALFADDPRRSSRRRSTSSTSCSRRRRA